MAAVVPNKSKVCPCLKAKVSNAERFSQATNVLLANLLILKMQLALFKNIEKLEPLWYFQYTCQQHRYDAWVRLKVESVVPPQHEVKGVPVSSANAVFVLLK